LFFVDLAHLRFSSQEMPLAGGVAQVWDRRISSRNYSTTPSTVAILRLRISKIVSTSVLYCPYHFYNEQCMTAKLSRLLQYES